MLGELVTRHVQGSVLDVTARVDLATFDDPEFHNRVQRQQAGNHQALQMVYGLSGLIGAVFGGIGALVGVVAVAPVLLPLLVLVVVPAWLAASKRGEAFWEFFWKMTPRDRQRHYLGRRAAGTQRGQGGPRVRAHRLPARPLRRALRRADRARCARSPGARSPVALVANLADRRRPRGHAARSWPG